jgi:hypothetical protein
LGEIKETDEETHDKAVLRLICAAASLEAFINELPAVADGVLRVGHQHAKMRTFSDLMNELEQSKGSLKSKLILAKWILCGIPFDKGASPFQDASALIDIRNALMHIKGFDVLGFEDEQPVFKYPRAFELLRAKKLINEIPPSYENGTGSWTEAILNLRCARWACNTVALIVREIIIGFPTDMPWPTIRKAYEDSFVPQQTHSAL